MLADKKCEMLSGLASAAEMVAWACINATALRQHNAERLRCTWLKAGRIASQIEPNDIPRLIRKTVGFDNSNEDSPFKNLAHMVQMQ